MEGYFDPLFFEETIIFQDSDSAKEHMHDTWGEDTVEQTRATDKMGGGCERPHRPPRHNVALHVLYVVSPRPWIHPDRDWSHCPSTRAEYRQGPTTMWGQLAQGVWRFFFFFFEILLLQGTVILSLRSHFSTPTRTRKIAGHEIRVFFNQNSTDCWEDVFVRCSVFGDCLVKV